MAKQTPKVSPKVEGSVIIQLPLLPDQEAEFKAHIWTIDELMTSLNDAVDEGYTFTLTKNEKYANYSCMVRQAYAANVNAGKAFFANAPTAFEALSLGVFKLFLAGLLTSWDVEQERPKSLYS